MKKVFKPTKMSLYGNKGQLLTSLCPWVLMADEGIVLLKNGALMCAFEFVAPDLDSCAASKIAAVANMFNNALMQLGEGWAIQFELQKLKSNNYPSTTISNIAGYMIERQREINFSFVQRHYENKYYFCLIYQLPPEITQKSAGIFYKKNEINKSMNIGLVENQIKKFKMEIGKTAGIIHSYMNVKMLNSNELFTYLHTSVSLDWHKMELPNEYKLFLDRAITDTDLETSMPMKLGNYYIPILAINSFPSQTIPAMLDMLNKADIPLRWSTRFITYSKETAIKKIDKAEKRFHSQRKSLGQWVLEATANIKSSREDSGAYAQESDASAARAECTMGITGFGDYTSNVMVWDQSLEKAEENARYIAGLIGSCNFSVKEETHNALQAFLSMQPGNIYANIRSLFVSTGNMSHVIPLSSVWGGMKQNHFLGLISGSSVPHVVCSTNAGIPFFLNFNSDDVGHHWVSGPTGAGKSTYLALTEIQWLKYPNSQVIIFDKDLSARCVTMCVGGTYIEPGKDDIAFQPLLEIDTDEEKRWASEFIECLLTEQNVLVSALMRKSIYQALVYMQEKPPEDRTLTSFWGYCDYQNPTTGLNDVKDGISPYLIGGQYGNLFDRVTLGIPITSWTMFEMGTLMNMSMGAVAPALLYLFRMCEKVFTGQPTLLVLDEAWVFLRNPIFANKITEWLKVLRKKHVFVVFATQEIEDAASSPVASTIISQCGSKVYLADDQATTKMMRDAYYLFGLEDSEIALLANSRKKEDYFFKSAQGTRQFQLNLDKLQLGILTNSDHALLNKIEQTHGKNTGVPRVKEILDSKEIEYNYLFN